VGEGATREEDLLRLVMWIIIVKLAAVLVGLGRIAALHHRSSASYQIR
jgi:hypothetical protein